MITLIPTSDIVAWSLNPRKRIDKKSLQPLVDSMRSVGWFGAIMVRPLDEGGYQVLAGERRWRAACEVGLREIAAEVRAMTDKEAIELAVIENRDRQDLDVIEEAGGYRAMVDLGWSVAEISSRSGRSEALIYAKLELLDLDEGVQDALREGWIGEKTALALGKIEDGAARAECLQRIVKPRVQDHPLTVRQALELIQEEYLGPQKRQKAWERRAAGLRREHGEGIEILSMAEAGRVSAVGSDYVRCDVRVPDYLLAAHVRDDEGFEAPLWGTLAEKHGARKTAAPDADGNAVFYVLSEPLITAEKVAGEADPRGCIFPLAKAEARHEQSVARQKTWAEQEQERRTRLEALGERQRELVLRLCGAFWGEDRPSLHEQEGMIGRLVPVLARHGLLEVFETVAEMHRVDLATLGDGDTSAGLACWVGRLLSSGVPAADVVTGLTLAAEVANVWTAGDAAAVTLDEVEEAMEHGGASGEHGGASGEHGGASGEHGAGRSETREREEDGDVAAWWRVVVKYGSGAGISAAVKRAVSGTGTIVLRLEAQGVRKEFGEDGLPAMRTCVRNEVLDPGAEDYCPKRAKRGEKLLGVIGELLGDG